MQNEHSEQRDVPAGEAPNVAERNLATFLLNDANAVAVGAAGGAVGAALR